MARNYSPKPVKGATGKAVEGKSGAEYARAVATTMHPRLSGAKRFTHDDLTIVLDEHPELVDDDTMVQVAVREVLRDNQTVHGPVLLRWSAPRFEVWDGTYWQEDVEVVDEDDIDAARKQKREPRMKTVKVDRERMVERPREALEEQIVETIHSLLEQEV